MFRPRRTATDSKEPDAAGAIRPTPAVGQGHAPSAPTYHRVDLPAVEGRTQTPDRPPSEPTREPLRWSVSFLAVALSVAQSVLWVWSTHTRETTLAGTLIPVLGYVLLVAAVLVVNPALAWLRRRVRWSPTPRPLGRGELVLLFCAMLVTSGISTFGLVGQVVPQIAAPFDPNWNRPQRGWDRLLASLNHDLYITDTEVIRGYREGAGHTPPESAGWRVHAEFYLRVLRSIPWLAWLGPLGCWAVFIAASYALFHSLAHVALPFWSKREQLSFPLARLPASVLPDEDRPAGAVPSIHRRLGHWLGFAFVFALLTWNGFVLSGRLAGVQPVRLGMSAHEVSQLLHPGAASGLGAATLILFTATSLAFLIPAEMSFSVWLYYLYGRGVLLAAILLGFGANTADFPSDYYWNSNIVSSQGGGAAFMFSAVSLARCLAELHRLSRGQPLARRIVIAMPVIGLGISATALSLWLSWAGLHWVWSLLFVVVMTLLTLGLMRMVAESGAYWIQTHTGFFHLYKSFGLGRFIAPGAIAAVFPAYSLLFLDVKCLLAPNLLNAARLRDDAGVGRARFHLTMFASVAASVVVSVFYSIFLAYVRGADHMHKWFYTICPQRVLDSARDAIADPPASVNPAHAGWFGFGAVWVVATMLLRRHLFWVPHPLGFIMLLNPLMDQLWLSFFIAWALKKCVVKYGDLHAHERARAVAIGVITGELTAIVTWLLVALATDTAMPYITIDRYAP